MSRVQASAATADAVTYIRSHISHPPPITCHANHRSKTPQEQDTAFKSDLKGNVDESKGILLPVRGLLLFSKPNEPQRVDFGAQKEAGFQSPLDVTSVFPM